jgi:hypothetical protein
MESPPLREWQPDPFSIGMTLRSSCIVSVHRFWRDGCP